MIKIVGRSSTAQISQGSGISGQMVGEIVSTAGAADQLSAKKGIIKVGKISGKQLRSGRLSTVNQRLRGAGRSVVASTSD
jgi:hypothetical protein